MRCAKILFLLFFLIFTLACQCVGPSYFIDWFQRNGQSVHTLTTTPVPTSDHISTGIIVSTQSVTLVPSQTATILVNPTTSSTVTTFPTMIPSPTREKENKSRTYDITETIELTNEGPGIAKRVVIWVALIHTIVPYQDVDYSDISTDDYITISDLYGNQFAQIEVDNLLTGETRILEFSYRVTVSEFTSELITCTGSSIDEYTEAEKYIESNAPMISSLAELLQQGRENNCETARAIYDYIGDSFDYSEYTPDDIGALQALKDGYGDCTEFSDLFVALNRAANIPANFVEGVTCCTTNGFTAGSVQHDWAEIFMPGSGWVPVDITWGRFPNKREMYFAQLPPDHIIVTRGRNLETLGGFHYYYYRYYWEGMETKVNAESTWSILESNR